MTPPERNSLPFDWILSPADLIFLKRIGVAAESKPAEARLMNASQSQPNSRKLPKIRSQLTEEKLMYRVICEAGTKRQSFLIATADYAKAIKEAIRAFWFGLNEEDRRADLSVVAMPVVER